MSPPIPIQLLSDSDSDSDDYTTTTTNGVVSHSTPISNPNTKKRQRPNFELPISDDVLVIPVDDDPSPIPHHKLIKSSGSESSSIIVPETPFSDSPRKPSRYCRGDVELIYVESQEKELVVNRVCSGFDGGKDLEPLFSTSSEEEEEEKKKGELDKWLDIDSMCYLHSALPSNATRATFTDSCVELDSQKSPGFRVECLDDSPPLIVQGELQSTKARHSPSFQDGVNHLRVIPDKESDKQNTGLESDYKVIGKEPNKGHAANKNTAKEEKMRLMEEKKRKKEQEKLQKAALKAEAAKLKEQEKVKKKMEKFKFSETDIVAEIDSKVIHLATIGGRLITKFGEKELRFNVTSNLVEKSIIWRMTVPEGMSQLSPPMTVIPYILLVYEAEEFCRIVNDGSLFSHISSIQTHYPDYKICFLTNRLMSYISKRENDKYNNKKNSSDWKRPPVEEVFAKLTTQFANVHSRQCYDEAEVAEHIVGFTSNLAKCHSRKRLTHLSVNANGSNVPKDCPDRGLIMKNLWLKALVSIPKVQPRFAIAIWKRYPNMKSLLSVYLDPTKSVHEKEFLLKDLPLEDLLGNDDRRLGEICSKRVYRVLMAQNGSIKTDDVENGADFFTQQS